MGVVDAVLARWEGSQITRVTVDWLLGLESSVDADIKTDLKALRVRAKDQYQNNPWAKKFVRNVRNNVVGSSGPVMQAVYRSRSGEKQVAVGDAIERAWKEFGKYGSPTVKRNTTLKQMFRDAISALPREGEVFFRKHIGYEGNRFGFALEPLESRLCPVDLNGNINKETVTLGIAIDSYGAAVAYYFEAESGPEYEVRLNGKTYSRIPAEEIYHFYLPEWVSQTRGVPWLATGLVDAKMLQSGREAELVATRASASKMGFFKQNGTTQYSGQGSDAAGHTINKAVPGSFEILPKDVDFIPYDPQHPNGNYTDFETRMLQGLAVGWGDNYHSMTGDYTRVNYSSLRQASLDVREEWKVLQDVFVDFLVARMSADWLAYCLPRGLIIGANGRPLRESIMGGLDVQFQCPRWDWVDPAKESRANDTDVSNGTRSVQEIIRARGRDPDEVFEERKEQARREAELLRISSNE